MMGRVVKISMGTAVAALLLGVCFTSAALALWLQTFVALTRETPVAEVLMSPVQTDESGDYIQIDFTPYVSQSALLHIFNREAAAPPTLEPGVTASYKIYGDTVAVRGPLVKLHPALLILNFNNVYKLALIEGEYRASGNPNAKGEGTEIPINGGFDDSWWNFNSREATFPYSLIVDRFTFAGDEEPGFFGGAKKRYQIVVTMDSITWNFIEDVAG